MFKSLLKVLPTLSGNVKICNFIDNIYSDDNISYYTNIKYAKLLPISHNLKQYNIQCNLLGSTYEYDIKEFYKYYSDSFYTNQFNNDNTFISKFNKDTSNENRNNDFEFGVKRISYQKNNEHDFAFFAPIYIDNINDLPKYFKIKITISKTGMKRTKYIYINIDNNHNKENYLYQYLYKYISKLDNKIIHCDENTLSAYYFATDVINGGFIKAKDTLISNNYLNQSTINEFDLNITYGFKRNNIIVSQILPLCYYINIEDIFNEKEKSLYNNCDITFSGSYYDNSYNKCKIYDIDTNYDNYYEYLLKFNNGEMTYIKSDIDSMAVNTPSLLENTYYKYAYSNKIAPLYNRWKLQYSDEKYPVITNMSYGFSAPYKSNIYGQYPSKYKAINAVCQYSSPETLDLILPYKDIEKKYYNSIEQNSYEGIFNNYVFNWFNVIDNLYMNNTEKFIKNSEWSNVINNTTLFNGILYNFSQLSINNYNIDKFGVFIHPEITNNKDSFSANYLLTNDSNKNKNCRSNILNIQNNIFELNNSNYNAAFQYSPRFIEKTPTKVSSNNKQYVIVNDFMTTHNIYYYVKDISNISEYVNEGFLELPIYYLNSNLSNTFFKQEYIDKKMIYDANKQLLTNLPVNNSFKDSKLYIKISLISNDNYLKLNDLLKKQVDTNIIYNYLPISDNTANYTTNIFKRQRNYFNNINKSICVVDPYNFENIKINNISLSNLCKKYNIDKKDAVYLQYKNLNYLNRQIYNYTYISNLPYLSDGHFSTKYIYIKRRIITNLYSDNNLSENKLINVNDEYKSIYEINNNLPLKDFNNILKFDDNLNKFYITRTDLENNKLNLIYDFLNNTNVETYTNNDNIYFDLYYKPDYTYIMDNNVYNLMNVDKSDKVTTRNDFYIYAVENPEIYTNTIYTLPRNVNTNNVIDIDRSFIPLFNITEAEYYDDTIFHDLKLQKQIVEKQIGENNSVFLYSMDDGVCLIDWDLLSNELKAQMETYTKYILLEDYNYEFENLENYNTGIKNIDNTFNIIKYFDAKLNKYINYGCYIIKYKFDNTNTSFFINKYNEYSHKYETVKYFNSINSEPFIEDNEILENVINKYFKKILSFAKFNITNILSNLNYLVKISKFDININYIPYKFIDNNFDLKNTTSILFNKKIAKHTLYRYLNDIIPNFIEVNNEIMYYANKMKIVGDKLLETYTFPEVDQYSLYKEISNINAYNGIRLYTSEKDYNIYKPIEYKFYQASKYIYLKKELNYEYKDLMTYDEMIKYETLDNAEQIFYKISDNRINNQKYLFNKYNVQFNSESQKLTDDLSEKLYKLTIKYILY